MRRLTACSAFLLLVGCGDSGERPAQEPAASEAPAPNAEREAGVLGQDIFDLVDRAMSYRSSHRGRLPRDLRELGIDELTPTTARSLTIAGNIPTVTVAFRNTANHILANCRGTNAILEEAALSGGEFSLICSLVAGGTTTLKARR